MAFDIGFIKAETHTPEYLMHKYWARKPHNVINECINVLTDEGDVVLDPFSGSGTVERVAIKYHRLSFGIELNFNYIKNIAHKRTANVQLALIGSPE